MGLLGDIAQIRKDTDALLFGQNGLALEVIHCRIALEKIVELLELLTEPVQVTGIGVNVAPPHPRIKGEQLMSTISYVVQKKSAAKQSAKAGTPKKHKAGDPAPPAVVVMDNEDGTFTVFGKDQGGQSVDIGGVATVTATSSDPTLLSIGTITGATVPFSGLKPGTGTIDVSATATDGSWGPFSLDPPLPFATTNSPVGGIDVTIGPNVPRP